MKTLKIIMLFIVVFMVSCSPKIYKSKQNPHLADNEAIIVIQNQKLPENAKKLTIIRVGNYDASFDCSYENVIEISKTSARKAGGNIIQIIEYKAPDAFSTCHRITANIYKLNNIESYNLTDETETLKKLPEIKDNLAENLPKDTTENSLNDALYKKIYKQVYEQVYEEIYTQKKAEDNLQNDTNKVEIKELYREKTFKNVIKIDPVVTIKTGLTTGGFEIDLRYARYLSKKTAVILDFNAGYIYGITGFVIMSGFEAVPVTHHQKSGLFFDAAMGISIAHASGYAEYYFNNTETAFCAASHIGYQIVSRKGFVFNPKIGFFYEGFSKKVYLHYMLNFGVAF